MHTANSLTEALLSELNNVYSAERQILDALPKLIKKVDSGMLRSALEDHLEATENQLARLDRIGAILKHKLNTRKCRGMLGLLEEIGELLEYEGENPAAIDVLLICAVQKVEHYEIAAYGTAIAMAEELGLDEVATLLDETLDEEKASDQRLTEISVGGILTEANSAQGRTRPPKDLNEIEKGQNGRR